jgi:hypothetical protein
MRDVRRSSPAIVSSLLFAVTMCSTFAAGQTSSANLDTQNAGTAAQTQAQNSTDNGWHFSASPYLWFAGLSGTVGALGHETSVHASIGDILSNFEIGLMGAAEARKNRWVIPMDLMWIKLKADHATSFDPGVSYATVKITQFVLTPGFGYRIVDNEKTKIDGQVGLRYWHLGQNVSFQPSGVLNNFSPSANWVDVVAGAKIEQAVSPKVLVTIFGDAGAGGANIDYQFGGLLGYKLSEKAILQAGWRYLDVNYRNSPPQLFVYDAHQSGALLGVTFNFK